MNEYNKNIGNRIRELRELSDITIKEIAEKSDNFVGVCVPNVYLNLAKDKLAGSKVHYGVENVYHEDKGAYTGEVRIPYTKKELESLIPSFESHYESLGGKNIIVDVLIKNLPVNIIRNDLVVVRTRIALGNWGDLIIGQSLVYPAHFVKRHAPDKACCVFVPVEKCITTCNYIYTEESYPTPAYITCRVGL